MQKCYGQLERTLFYATLAAVFLVISCSYFLPMVDLPQHAAQVQAFKAMIRGNSTLPWLDNLQINWFTGYWIGYASTLLFSLFLPLNYAINLVVAAAFLLFVLSFSMLRKKLGIPPIFDWIFIPSFFGFTYILGFITYLLAIPFGIFLLIANLNLIEKYSLKNIITVLGLGILLYFSHILIFLFFCMISALMSLVDQKNNIKEKIKKLIPFYFLALFIPVFILSPDFFNEDDLAIYFDKQFYPNFKFGFFGSKILNFLIYPWTIDSKIYDVISPYTFVIIFIFVFSFPFLTGMKLTRDWKRYVPIASFLIAWFCFPTQAAKTSFIYQRFSIFLFPFLILIFENKITNKIHCVTSYFIIPMWISFSILMTFIPMRDIFLFNKENKDFISIINQIPERKQALFLSYATSNIYGRQTALYANFPVWYQALRNGWVEFNFAWFPAQIVRYKVNHVPENRPGFVWNPSNFIHFKNCDIYDLLIVHMETQKEEEEHQKLMQQSTCSHVLSIQIGFWYVYALKNNDQPDR